MARSAECHEEREHYARTMCRPCYNAEHRRANPAIYRQGSSTYRAKNPDVVRAYNEAWRAANPDYGTEWRDANPDKRREEKARPRARKAGVTAVRVESNHCGVCGGSLFADRRYPDLWATTTGHEPPLSRVSELGVSEVIERPEHWGCNRSKGRRLDSEMGAAQC